MNILLILETLLIFSLILGTIVLLHELGHFIAAKLVGCKVEAFAFGFGPSIWKKKIGETDYRWNLIPLGGYCQIMGETEEINDPRALSSKNPFQKIFVFVAGVIMNFLLAALVFTIFLAISKFKTYLPKLPSDDMRFVGAEQTVLNKPLITAIAEQKPASDSKMKTEEFLWKVDNLDIDSIDTFRNYLQDKFGQTITIQTFTAENQTFQNYKLNLNYKDESGKVLTGISTSNVSFYFLDYSRNAALSGLSHSINTSIYTFKFFNYLLSESKKAGNLEPLSQGTGTILKAGEYTYKFVKADNFLDILNLLAGISLSVGIMNILPIPPLDGGHVLFTLIEAVLGRKVPDKIKSAIFTVFFFLIILLFLLMLFKDLQTTDIGFIKDLFVKLGWR